MANLTRTQASNLIQSPRNSREIQAAIRKKRRNNLHTQPVADSSSVYYGTLPGHSEFLHWVKSLLGSKQNYQRYESLYRPPVPTNQLTDSIFSEFTRIFEAQDSFFKFEFKDSEAEQDFHRYRDVLKDTEFMKESGFSAFKESIDSFVVIDMPEIQQDEQGNQILREDEDPLNEPYPIMVDIESVVDVEVSKTRNFDRSSNAPTYLFNVEYIIFHENSNKIIVIDDEFYRIFVREEDKTLPWKFLSEFAHNLGYCPAKSFYNTPLNSKSKIQKLGRIDQSLTELDWLLFWKYARKYLEMYAAFPIYVMFKEKCNYEDEEGRRCVNGSIRYNYRPIEGGKTVQKTKGCPKCGGSGISPGPGSVKLIDPPQDKDDPRLMDNPIKVVPAEKNSLEYVQDREKELETNIFLNSRGRDADPKNDQAKNVKQVMAQFESRTNVVIEVKSNFEIIHHFILDTIARLRYPTLYIKGTVNYGTEFFLKDVKDQEMEYKSAKDNGLPMYDLSSRRDLLYHTKYRNNPDKLERAMILGKLEPFPDLTINEILDIKSKSPFAIKDEMVILKIYFNEFIDRFEREQTSILQFGIKMASMDLRIRTIKDVLMSYVREILPVVDDSNGPIDTPDDIEAQAKAKLKGSVGGVQGILGIQQQFANGGDRQAALSTLKIVYGYNDQQAIDLLGAKPGTIPASAPAPPTE